MELNEKVNPLLKNSSLDLNELIETSIMASEDNSEIRGIITTNRTKNSTRKLSASADELEDDNIEKPYANKLNYSIIIIESTQEYIKFRLYFLDMTLVSLWKENDMLYFNITQPYWFEPEFWVEGSSFNKEAVKEIIIIKSIP